MKGRRPRTTPGTLRALTLLVVLATGGLLLVTRTAVDNARVSVDVIGHGEGPQVVATADLYFALSDMDAQVAGVLLAGREEDLGPGRDRALARYEQRRTQANAALLHVADLTGNSPAERATIRAVLDGLGRYERLAAEAMLLNRQAGPAAGLPPPEVLDVYREATDLMRLELLPKAYNLTLESGTIVRRTYEDEYEATLAGRLVLLPAGVIAVAALIGLQVYIGVRFRRRLSPALLAATLATLLLVVGGVVVLSGAGGEVRVAKQEGFDAIVSLSRARAISTSLHADQRRYLLDPGRADTYEQVYFDKSQAIVYVPAGNLRTYYAGVSAVAQAYRTGRAPSQLLGLLGPLGGDAQAVSGMADERSLRRVFSAYERFQADDRRMRERASGGDSRGAIEVQMGQGQDSFAAYDEALRALISEHRRAFDEAIASADRRLAGWDVFPPVLVLGIWVLCVAGVAPRLAEYR